MKKIITLKNLFLIILVYIFSEKKDLRCNVIKGNNIKDDEDKRFHLFYYSHNLFKTPETKEKKNKKECFYKNGGIYNLSKEIRMRKDTSVKIKQRTCPFHKEGSSFEMGSKNITCFYPIVGKKERKTLDTIIIKKNVTNDHVVSSDMHSNVQEKNMILIRNIDKENKNDIQNVEEKIQRDTYENKDYESDDTLIEWFDDNTNEENFLLTFLKRCLMKIFSSPKRKKTVVQKKHKSNFFINSSLKYIYMYIL